MAQKPTDQLQGEPELRAALAERNILFAELEHRTRNTLQMIAGFLQLAAKAAEHPEAKAALKDVMRRVQMVDVAERTLLSLAAIDRVDLGIFLPQVVNELMALEGRGGVNFESSAECVVTSVHQATALGMVVNELATNALKHAFPGGSGMLRLEVRSLEDGRAQAVVVDDGVGTAMARGPRPGGGMGTQIG